MTKWRCPTLVADRTSSLAALLVSSLFRRTAAFLIMVGFLASACSFRTDGKPPSSTDKLIIFHAGSLTLPVERLSTAFEDLYPGVEILSEAAGSRTTARKISELQREADLVMSADYQVINTLLIPDHADWNIQFATNSMVIVYSDRAAYAEEVSPENWYEVLTREDVIVGRSNPEADPNGYRTLMVWQLAENYYDQPGLFEHLVAASPEENIRPKEVDLIPLIQSGDMDYAFNYRSVALQHGLLYIDLPPEIDLGDPSYADYYQQAVVELDGDAPGAVILRWGEPIIYGITIPRNAPNPELAALFLDFLFSTTGREIQAREGQTPLDPPRTETYDDLGKSLQQIVSPNE